MPTDGQHICTFWTEELVISPVLLINQTLGEDFLTLVQLALRAIQEVVTVDKWNFSLKLAL